MGAKLYEGKGGLKKRCVKGGQKVPPRRPTVTVVLDDECLKMLDGFVAAYQETDRAVVTRSKIVRRAIKFANWHAAMFDRMFPLGSSPVRGSGSMGP